MLLTEKDIVAAHNELGERRELVRQMCEQWSVAQVIQYVEYHCAAKANGYAYKAEVSSGAEQDNLRMYERSYSKASSIVGNCLDKIREVLG